MPLNAFTYLTQIPRITIAKSLSHFTLACTLKGMDPTPHVVMPRSSNMVLGASLTSASLGTSGVSFMATWSLSHFRFACLLAFAIAFYSLQRNRANGLLKTYAFMAMWF